MRPAWPMTFMLMFALLIGTLGFAPAPTALAAQPVPRLAFAPIGSYNTGLGVGSAETVDFAGELLFVTNGENNSLDIVTTANAAAPTLVQRIDLSPYGAGPNSVAVRGNLVAVAVEADPKTDPGKVVFFNRQGRFLNAFTVGALPDMLTFTPNGHLLLVANEGEPNNDYTIDPEGSVSIIPVWQGVQRLPQANIKTLTFHKFERGAECEDDIDPGVRIFGPTANRDTNPRAVSQNLEPEYITISPDNRFAYVSLQENNAIGIIDLRLEEFVRIAALGEKDHSLPGNGLDASDRDNAINIANWPVFGMYQPDAIANYRVRGQTYIVTANEGDARDYAAFAEEVRVGANAYRLDPTIFPNAAELKRPENLGRLTATSVDGLNPQTGFYEKIHVFGARSFSIWNDRFEQVYDSGDDFEQITAAVFPANFNSNNTANTFDDRSDNKGPEPEGVAIGQIRNRHYAFVGLERIGGLMIYDITDPAAPQFMQYTNNRDFSGVEVGPDSGAEIVTFVPANRSPSRKPRVLVGNEVTGTVTIYEEVDPDGAGALTLLHNNDGESSLLPFTNNVSGTSLPVGGVAAFKTLTDQQIRAARSAGNAVVNVYAGDAFLASSTLACSLPPNPATTPIYDAVAQRQIAYDAHIFGNHEFDFSPDFLERFIRSFAVNGVLTQPFLSANLDFSAEPGFADLIRADGLITGTSTDGRVVARSLIVTDKVNGQRVGVVSATTPLLPTISSPRNVQLLSTDNPSTATVVQGEVDRLTALGVKRIVFVSHLQNVNNDREVVRLLRNVDIVVAGGGDELLANDPATLLPGEQAGIAGPYPLVETDADGRPVYLVTTAGNYKYLGRIDAVFDAEGRVVSINAATSFPRRVIPTSAAATTLGLADAVTPDPGITASVITPVQACLATLSQPIARTEVPLNVSQGGIASQPGVGVRNAETNAGNLITDAFLDSYDRYAPQFGLPARGPGNPVIAVQNGGGIRQNAGDVLPVGGVTPGPITRQNTLDVLAFLTNSITVVLEVSPDDLKTILERSAASLPARGGQFLQIAGLRVVYNISNPVGSRVITATLEDGTPLIADGAAVAGAPNVAVVTNSFTAAGGDNYPTFANNPNKVQFPATYEQAWVEYLLSFPPASGLPTIPASDPRYQPGGEGRITIVP
jgi:2',3'-cyclic-nucleotide 2'-phosphodiesterase / 3'-nucleotidase / 5'-nucleotidase